MRCRFTRVWDRTGCLLVKGSRGDCHRLRHGRCDAREHYDTDVTDGWRRGRELQAVEEALLFIHLFRSKVFVHITDIYDLAWVQAARAQKLHPKHGYDMQFHVG